MVIGYRRLSGKVNLSDSDTGTRGSWWEKRRALFSFIQGLGHTLEVLHTSTTPGTFDVLLVEFGSVNRLFHAKALLETQEIINRKHGRVVFLCDDPDMPMPWGMVHHPQNWEMWANAWSCSGLGSYHPSSVPVKDFPFSSLQEPRSPSAAEDDAFCYIGRPNGREKVFRAIYNAQVPFQVYGKPKEWLDLGLVALPGPTQVERSNFYNRRFACLGIADSKHKRLGWRTGRMYHAALAGCPVAVEADHHPKVRETFQTFRAAADLFGVRIRWRDADRRIQSVLASQIRIREERVLCERRFADLGLV